MFALLRLVLLVVRFRRAAAALGLLALFGLPAEASTVGAFTHAYGVNARDPGGSDRLIGGAVIVATGSAVRFADVFDLSAFEAAPSIGLELTLYHHHADAAEGWSVRAEVAGTAIETALAPGKAATTLRIGTEGMTALLADEVLRFGFESTAAGAQDFRLYAATLSVAEADGMDVPLPASGLLLLGGLGALAWRRRAARPA